jgi:hypothetical protein
MRTELSVIRWQARLPVFKAGYVMRVLLATALESDNTAEGSAKVTSPLMTIGTHCGSSEVLWSVARIILGLASSSCSGATGSAHHADTIRDNITLVTR